MPSLSVSLRPSRPVLQAFQRMMEEQLKVVAANEAEEAEEEAGERAEREAFEQRCALLERAWGV